MSQKDPITKRINGKEYKMYPLSPRESMDYLTEVTSVVIPVVGPVLSSIFSGNTKDKDIMDREVNLDFASAASKLNSREFIDIRHRLEDALAEVTFVDNAKLSAIFDAHFYGNIHEMMQWLIWGMQVQWGKSLSALLKKIPNQGAVNPLESRSPKV